jgi:hypothetical protein
MGRHQLDATKKALSMIGKKRKGGGVHTPHSAAKACGISPTTLYKHKARSHANLASSSNEGVSGESQ